MKYWYYTIKFRRFRTSIKPTLAYGIVIADTRDDAFEYLRKRYRNIIETQLDDGVDKGKEKGIAIQISMCDEY